MNLVGTKKQSNPRGLRQTEHELGGHLAWVIHIVRIIRAWLPHMIFESRLHLMPNLYWIEKILYCFRWIILVHFREQYSTFPLTKLDCLSGSACSFQLPEILYACFRCTQVRAILRTSIFGFKIGLTIKITNYHIMTT